MEAVELRESLRQRLRETSGLEARRPYLGMSGISNCPRKLYFDFVDGREPAGDQQHYYCWSGYMYEARIVELIGGEKEEIEVVAEFDSRFRGHVDYLYQGPDEGKTLLEIKSVNFSKFEKIQEQRRPLFEHGDQVQMYLCHGGWKRAAIIYIARDVPWQAWKNGQEIPIEVFEVLPDPVLQEHLNRKAARILKAVDERTLPRCECGYCKR